ncbi:PREDICTED: WD repeat-containing protein 74 [Drosophila arizonae]|uniref:WD repeat-containing protein 74 n=1 Tax=Drosophila arizonae TaxID=7263 RepID=A0ABM1PNE5_DROAR|nr:PREDICTED: WD repeat-containing protein 74 [Drosophila arizonae]
MKWTTANLKHANYTAKHELFVGTHTGSFKHLLPALEKNPYIQSNLTDVAALDKDSRVTALAFGNEAQTEILLGRAKNVAEVHSLGVSGASSMRHINVAAAPIVGLARYNNKLIAGFSNGKIQTMSLDALEEEESAAEPILIATGDHMDHLRQCSTARQIVATGGKARQNNLKVYDLSDDGKQIFSSKNLPNDYLQLEVPVWDSDIGFVDGPSVLATCSRHGYVRLYDTRKQRRPVAHFASEEHGMSFASLVAYNHYIYTGTTMGVLKAFDTRRMKTHVHTYKGFTGGISDLHLDETGKYLSSASLDRYVRIHDADSTVLLYQCYVKSKATKVLINQLPQQRQLSEDDNEAEAEVQKHKSIKNKRESKAAPLDAEYEDMFEQMATVGDSDDEAAEQQTTVAQKRKTTTQSQKAKKKK